MWSFFRKNKRVESDMRKKILNEDINFNDVIYNSFHAQSLYDELKRLCHPDRFLDQRKNHLANELFQKLTENKHNYNELVKLKVIIDKELRL